MNYYIIDEQWYGSDELYHHGIMGMKWGKRNGPPYPLSSGAHSIREKKLGTKGWTAEAKADAKKTRKNTEDAVKEAKNKSSKVSDKDVNKYRSEMIEKYAKSDPKKANEYKNASEKDLAEEYQRRKELTKTVAITAGVVGVGAAVFLAYRYGVIQRLKKAGVTKVDDTTEMVVKQAFLDSLRDVDYVIKQGDILHRMVGFENFDVKKTAGKFTYVTTKESDRLAYMAFLKDWSGTGKRYDVTLEAVKDIIAPSNPKAKKIFYELWNTDPSYKNELINTYSEALGKLHGVDKDDDLWADVVEMATSQVTKDPFKYGIYTIAKQRSDSHKLIEEYKKAGYSAIVDYFDKGVMGEQPLILFDAASDVVKTGEKFVTDSMRVDAIKALSKMVGHPLQKTAASLGDYEIERLIADLTGK